MNKKNTKRALLMSCLSMLLCMSMLVGTTFAWFTDTDTLAVSNIVSGTLDIEIIDAKTGAVKTDALDFVNASGSSDILWEPGATFRTEGFQIKNVGSLWLKFKVEITNTEDKLNEVITFSLVDDNGTKIDLATMQNLPLGPNTTYGPNTTLYIEGHMDENAGNEYQDLILSGVGITINAGQYAAEYDSFGNTYDESAQYEESDTAGSQTPTIFSQDDLTAAIFAAGTDPVVLVLADGTYVLPTDSSMQNKTITIAGSDAVVIDYTNMGNVFGWAADNVGTILTFDGVTVNWQTGNQGYQGIKNPQRVIYKNCTITGTQFMYSGADFINCTFTSTDYCVYLRANGDYTFTGCTFNTDGKAIMMYHDQGNTANVVLTDCKFYSNDTITGKAAVETGDDSKTCVYNITFVNCTQEGFDINPNGISTGSELWGNKNSIPTDRLNVIIDGKDVY